MAADVREVTLLGLVDLSAAFDCVDHSVLLQRLISLGLKGTVLDWICSFLSDRTQQIAYLGQLSDVQPVLYGVPQGSVIVPLQYVLYTAELHLLVEQHGVSMHQYADDCQFYLCTPVSQAAAAVSKLSKCLTDNHHWLSRADCISIPLRRRRCGVGLASSWTRSTSERFQSCRPVSRSNTASETLVSFSTADSIWPTMSLPYVTLATTNCVSSAQWYVPCKLMAPRPMPSFRAGLITATCYLLVSPIACFVDYSLSRMRPPVLLPALFDVNTLRQYSGNFIDYQYVSVFGKTGNPGIPITIRPGAKLSYQ